MTEQNRTDVKVIFALTLIHFAGDFYVSFVNPLLPVFVDRFGLSLAQVGLIAGMMRMLAFIVQPGVGYFADRYRSRIFILGGPLLSIVFICRGRLGPLVLGPSALHRGRRRSGHRCSTPPWRG